MTEVRRYSLVGEYEPTMMQQDDGEYVLASDYDALAARVQAVEEVNRIAAIKATVGDTEYSLRQQLADMTAERDDCAAGT